MGHNYVILEKSDNYFYVEDKNQRRTLKFIVDLNLHLLKCVTSSKDFQVWYIRYHDKSDVAIKLLPQYKRWHSEEFKEDYLRKIVKAVFDANLNKIILGEPNDK